SSRGSRKNLFGNGGPRQAGGVTVGDQPITLWRPGCPTGYPAAYATGDDVVVHTSPPRWRVAPPADHHASGGRRTAPELAMWRTTRSRWHRTGIFHCPGKLPQTTPVSPGIDKQHLSDTATKQPGKAC